MRALVRRQILKMPHRPGHYDILDRRSNEPGDKAPPNGEEEDKS